MSQQFGSIISSDEPLLMMERCDAIIAEAKANGVSQRDIIEANESTDWNLVGADAASMSLFAEAKMLDIRFSKAPAAKSQQALIALFEQLSAEFWILLRLPKLDKRQQNAKWFKTISANASWQLLWPPKPEQLAGWLRQRAEGKNLKLSHDALLLLTEHSEGNLLAAEQTLEKLSLLAIEGEITAEQIRNAGGDNARYNVFSCAEAALAGDASRAVKILHRLQQEGVAAIVILNLLLRDIEAGLHLSIAISRQEPTDNVCKQLRIWDSKKRLYLNVVGKIPLPVWERLLLRAAQVDKMIKGQAEGDPWMELETALRTIAGQPFWGRSANKTRATSGVA